MTDLISFTFHQQSVRVVDRDDAPWWIAADVAAILGYRNAPDMARNLDPDEAATQIVRSSGQDREMLILSESGLYHAIFASRRPEAQAFRRWVTGTVLPQIRRTGGYALVASPLDRLTAALDAYSCVTTAGAAMLAGLPDDTDGLHHAASLLRAVGWQRAWVAPGAVEEV